LAAEGWAMPQAAFFADPQPWQEVDASLSVRMTAPAIESAVPAWAQEDDAPAVPDDEEAQDVYQGTIEPDPEWADAAEASVIASLQAEADNLQARLNAAEEDDDDPEMRFDEDILRELVRDILREELAGKMGERITRNIRKLVRAEIATIMATQSLG
jgi:hypothetical protein